MLTHDAAFAYRDYGNFVLVFGTKNRGHFVIQDVFADFFRLYFYKNLDKEEIVQKICSEYNVDKATVENDFEAFASEIKQLSGPFADGLGDIQMPSDALSDHDIYAIMSQACIPFSATIEITDACNESCVHCYRGAYKKSYWTPETFEHVLEQLRDMGCMHLTITGGEPLAHDDFLRLIDLVHQYGFVLTLQTNGLLVDESLAERLSSVPIKDVAISLYSTDPDIHDSITRVPGSCVRTMDAIRAIRNKELPTSINMPVMTLNEGSMAGVKAFADEVQGLCHFTFKIIPSQDGNKETKHLNCFSEQKLYECMADPAIQLYNNLLGELEVTTARERYCDACFRSITLDAQGNVVICNAFRRICGNVAETPLMQIWTESEAINRWRTATCLVNEECKNCKAYAYCEPCPAHSHTLTGDDSSIDEITCAFGKAFYNAAKRLESLQEGGVANEGV